MSAFPESITVPGCLLQNETAERKEEKKEEKNAKKGCTICWYFSHTKKRVCSF